MTTGALGRRFSGMAESIWSDRVSKSKPKPEPRLNRLPSVGPGPGQRTCREDHALSHRPQMSSGRLFLDRVARQHCPSPLHRHPQINMHFWETWGKGDISTLLSRGHFYFALTLASVFCQGKVESSASQQSRKFRFGVTTREVRGSLSVPAKRRRALVASNPIAE